MSYYLDKFQYKCSRSKFCAPESDRTIDSISLEMDHSRELSSERGINFMLFVCSLDGNICQELTEEAHTVCTTDRFHNVITSSV